MADVSVNHATNNENHNESGVRLITLNLPEDEGEGLGFRLTRTLWDPYPWVREVVAASRAESAGLKAGDCVLQADGKDLLGLPIGKVAGLIRGDGSGHGVSLLVWNCGVDPQDDPELLWSCGGGVRGERARRALSGVVRALSCCVCAATARRALSCARSHLYCEGCWSRLQRCALCRETLPANDSPYAKNLVAEQVFEAIATEYKIKDTLKKATETVSARTSPNISPAVNRRNQYSLSMMQKSKKSVQFGDRFNQNYASDPNLSRTLNQECRTQMKTQREDSENNTSGNTSECQSCCCRQARQKKSEQCVQDNVFSIPQINIENLEDVQDKSSSGSNQSVQFVGLQHKLVTRLRPASSLADIKKSCQQSCQLSRSLNSIDISSCGNDKNHSGSLENMKSCIGSCENSPVLLLSTPPIYILTCDHKTT